MRAVSSACCWRRVDHLKWVGALASFPGFGRASSSSSDRSPDSFVATVFFSLVGFDFDFEVQTSSTGVFQYAISDVVMFSRSPSPYCTFHTTMLSPFTVTLWGPDTTSPSKNPLDPKCHRASCLTDGRDPYTLRYEWLSMDEARL